MKGAERDAVSHCVKLNNGYPQNVEVGSWKGTFRAAVFQVSVSMLILG